tara:strand:+ start:42 stop:173 length:132 start_codon:yes stop_codon:yes gene_type:complete
MRAMAKFLTVEEAVRYTLGIVGKNLFIQKELDGRYHVYDMEVK